MTYYFLHTYSDDRNTDVEGLYACDHEVTRQQWEDFRITDSLVRERVREEMVPLDTPRNRVLRTPELLAQLDQFIAWDRAQPSAGRQFIAKHNMRKVDYVEIDE